MVPSFFQQKFFPWKKNEKNLPMVFTLYITLKQCKLVHGCLNWLGHLLFSSDYFSLRNTLHLILMDSPGPYRIDKSRYCLGVIPHHE